MSIAVSDLKWLKSKMVTNTSANGGKMSASNQVVTDIRNNVFPDISEQERTNGVTRYRKLFLKVADTGNLTFFNSKIHLSSITPADDFVIIFEGTQIDTQSDISSPVEYGAALLNSDITAGDTSLVVLLEDDSMEIFHDTDTIFISDGVNEEYHENVTVSKDSLEYTITLESGDSILNNFTTADNTVVASCILSGDIAASMSSWNITSTSGTYSDESSNLVLDSIGSIQADWTFTFTSSTEFTCTENTLGTVGSGNISTNYSPNNPNHSRPYFTLAAAAFGGTWEIDDTITFTTSPAAFPVWFKQVVNAGAGSYSGNNFDFRIRGETS